MIVIQAPTIRVERAGGFHEYFIDRACDLLISVTLHSIEPGRAPCAVFQADTSDDGKSWSEHSSGAVIPGESWHAIVAASALPGGVRIGWSGGEGDSICFTALVAAA